ncbi:MAG TPA: F0F1 ATP synthase subunit epsilon [Smithellaceae bacterium]|jgi:F-type H+-transporting ATPase subunit epsilon|nr:F0F1 ATP synthase subunit epsilon [Syntrophaceae bacterium]HOE80411.1 F0F1 ATP synthase subunit epsilon [Smithellaceae bacterium]MBP9011589.1 F0F1 ATP synthase subunit epsilon [Syntrophaceae bacterium]HPL96847.1 F0F1 ATP synthase subunit epsilon [Smithellaceae bacterium]HPV48889.1 F0F1 ATP synthase subunit epsilon [Smithellaceae bacterium]
MLLKILLPAEVLLVEEVKKIIAEAENGSFCLMPNHIDFVATLAPGIFQFEKAMGGQELLAMDVGTLVKKGADVLVSTRNAVKAPDLGKLKEVVVQQYDILDEREKMVRSAAAKLEASLIRRFVELK